MKLIDVMLALAFMILVLVIVIPSPEMPMFRKTGVFSIGSQIYERGSTEYWLSGIRNESLTITVRTGHLFGVDISTLEIPLNEGISFTLGDRDFKLVEYGEDYIKLEWEDWK